MNFEMLHPADQLVMMMDRIYSYGMTTTSGGNLSIRDSNGDVWITPGGVDKGTLKREDIVKVDVNGNITGAHKPSSELPFHLSVYKMRPDLNAVVHAHPPALVAFSAVRRLPDTKLVASSSFIVGDIAMAEYALPGSMDLGEKIAAYFNKGFNTVMLENHGIVTGAPDLFQAFMAFETLDFCARTQLNAMAIGTPRSLTPKQLEQCRLKQHPAMYTLKRQTPTSEELFYRGEMCRMIGRAYEQQLFTSTQGTFSRRLSDGSFLITPYALDRKYLAPEDMVLIKNGCCEEGKIPSRSVRIHEGIYNKNADINSIIVAHPPYTMAFALTDQAFDARLIPEAYILLRDVRKLPFGSNFMQPELTVAEMSTHSPVAIIENDSIMVVGADLMNAFDRLEVLEYSAKAIISARLIGDVVNISDAEIKELETAFNLK